MRGFLFLLPLCLSCAPTKGTTPGASAPTPTDITTDPITNNPRSTGTCSAEGCLDFEQITTLDSLSGWQFAAPNCQGTGRIALDTSFVHSGTGALRVDGQGGYCNHAFLGLKTQVWNKGAPLHGRFFMALDKPLGDAHITLVTLHDSVENKDIRLGGQSKILMWNRESDDATLPELSPQGIAKSLNFTARQWYCVSFTFDPTTGTLSTRVNNQDVAALQVDGVATPDVDGQWLRKANYRPQPVDVKLGYESYGGDANTVWYDDLRIGTENLDCDS